MYFTNGQICWVKTRDLNNTYITNTEEQITQKALIETNLKLLPIDSILIAMYGGFGQIGKTGLLKVRACSNQALSSLQLNKDISPRFILEYLNFRRFYWKRYAASSRKDPNITKKDIEVFPISLPPLKEQKKIAKILTAWSNAISKQEELIKVRQENKKALMQKLLSGEIRFDGFNGKWKKVKLFEIAKITMGQSPSSTSYNENKIGIPLIQGNADCKNRKTLPRIYTTEKVKECFIGDIILTVRAPVGFVSKSFHNACIGRGVCAIKSKENQNFLYHFFINYENNWKIISQGSTFKSVNSNDIKNIRIKLPPLKEQQQIAEVLTLAEQKIELLKSELIELKEQKKALMQKLLTGKIRVKV